MSRLKRVESPKTDGQTDMLECISSPHEPNTPFVLLIPGAHSPNVTHSYTNTLISLEGVGGGVFWELYIIRCKEVITL